MAKTWAMLFLKLRNAACAQHEQYRTRSFVKPAELWHVSILSDDCCGGTADRAACLLLLTVSVGCASLYVLHQSANMAFSFCRRLQHRN